jgi:hypothetical protein
MTTLDPDAVQVLAQVFHRVQCLPGGGLYASYSEAHRNADRRAARELLASCAEAGYALIPKEGS